MRPLTRVMPIVLLGLAACLDGTTDPKTSGGSGLSLTILPGPGGVTALDSGRVVVAGPTNRTVKVTPGTTVTIDQLLPGTYTVTLQGFQGGGVAYFGQTSGVTVVVGQNTSATVTFASFRPAILQLPAYTTDGQFVLVYSKVAAAASYIVQRSADAAFTSPTETAVAATDTTVALTIPLTGPFYMRVLALDPLGARGIASVAQVTTTLTSVTVTPPTASIAPAATQQFAAVAKDAQNNTISGITFFWVSSNQSVALVDQTGLATGMTGGSATISALGLGVPGGAALTVSATVPTQLAFTVQPSNATAGDALSPAVQVEIRDASGARVVGARDPVTLAFGVNPGGGTLAGTKTVNGVNGIATFSGLSVDKVGTGYTLAASSGTLTGATSAAFDIAVGLPARLAFSVQPTNVGLGRVPTPAIEVAVVDRLGNTVTGATNSITVSIGANPTGGSLSGTRTVDALNGVATFADLAIRGEAGSGYTLAAASGALTGATAPFDVTNKAVVTLRTAGAVSVIETATNTEDATLAVGGGPYEDVGFTADGVFAYVPNNGSGTVSAINTVTGAVATVTVGTGPRGLAVTPNGAFVYVTNNTSNNVSVIRTSDNAVVASPAVGTFPIRAAVTPDGNSVYVTNFSTNNVSVIATATNTVGPTIAVGTGPQGVAVTPDGAFVYVANSQNDTVSVISTSSNTVVASIRVGDFPVGVAASPDGAFVYVVNQGEQTLSVISTHLRAVVGGVTLGGNCRNIALSPGGAFAYIPDQGRSVLVVSTATRSVVGTVTLAAGTTPTGIGIAPKSP